MPAWSSPPRATPISVMETPRLLDDDPLTGLKQYYHFDPDTRGFVLETQQDVEGIIELNKAVANDQAEGWKGELHHVAHFPLIILMRLAQQGILGFGGEVIDQKRYKAWLNAPENHHFRVKRGRV